MSLPTAFCFVLAGIALAVMAQPTPERFRPPVLAALGAALILVAGLACVGHALDALFGIRFLDYSRIANSPSVGFVFLGCALLIAVRSEGALTWSLDTFTSGGFAIGTLSMLVVAGLSYEFTRQLEQDAGWVGPHARGNQMD